MPVSEEGNCRADWVRIVEDCGQKLIEDTPGLVSLELDELLSTARTAVGRDDFGAEDFIEPLEVLLKSLNEDADLTLIGRLLVRSDILNLLQNRLKIAEWIRLEPAVLDQEIHRPLFVIGLPRSGTTILHELIALDPNLRAPLTWEGRFPCPPSTDDTYLTDSRIESADRIFKFWSELVPDFATMHETGGHLPCECIQLTAHSFRSEEFLGRQQTASYGAWLSSADMRPAYRYHRLMLQMFQASLQTTRWILKAPSHMGAVEALFAEYPDACIIQTHRDPLQSMASTASLLSAHAWMRAREVDDELIAMAFAGEGMAARLENVNRIRDGRPDLADQFHDVRFVDLMEDPVSVLREIYAHYALEFGPVEAERIRAYLDAKPRGRDGRHEYRFEDLGVHIGSERERFKAYQERFSVPSEI
jgi:hypothetical protein